MNYTKIRNSINALFAGFSSHFSGRKQPVFFDFLSPLSLLCLFLACSSQTEQHQASAVKENLETGLVVQEGNKSEGDTINHPEVVQPENDGSLRLYAEIAEAIGPEIKYMPEEKAFGWFTAEDRVEWDVEVSQSGIYVVYLEWSVSDEEAGKPFLFEAGDEQLKGKVGRTGSWQKFKTEKVGRIQLSAGRQKMILRPASTFDKGGALLDLREVKLVLLK